MDSTKLIVSVAGILLLSGNAFADAGDRIENRLDNRGDRIENRLDNKGDRIDNRLDRRAEQTSSTARAIASIANWTVKASA